MKPHLRPSASWRLCAGCGLLLLLLALLPCLSARAQDEDFYTREIGLSLGTTSLLGDTNTSLFGEPALSVGAALRFVFNPRSALITRLNYSPLSGTHLPSEDFYVRQPNVPVTQGFGYHYRSHLIDLTAAYELHFLPYGYRAGFEGYRRLVPYMQLGAGFAYSTVGRSLTLVLPLGLGLKWKAAERWNLSLGWQINFGLSDRLDGLEAPTTLRSEMFRDKDHYGQLLLTLTYDFAPRCPTCNKAD